MRTKKLVIATLVIILFAFAKPPRKVAIVFIGDSITQGGGGAEVLGTYWAKAIKKIL